MKRRSLYVCLSLLLILFSNAWVLAQAVNVPDSVTIAGTIQSALGCPGDWQPECALTHLTFDEEDQLWEASFVLPAGEYEYKAALNDSWDLNYGAGAEQNGPNIPLVLEEERTVTFFFDANTGWITDDVNSLIVNVPGSYQSEIGCTDDWAPTCLRSWLQDPDGDGVFTFRTEAIPAGAFEAKVAADQSWALNWGANGAQNGANIPFVVPEDNTLVEFVFNTSDHVMTINVGGEAASTLVGNLFTAQAHWVTADTILWDIGRVPGASYRLHYSLDGALELTEAGIAGGDFIELTPDRAGVTDEIAAKFPQLARFSAFKLKPEDLAAVPEILKGQIAIDGVTQQGLLLGATLLQFPGVLDDLYTYDGPLGVTWNGDVPTLSVWAPTARSVKLHLFADSSADATATVLDMTHDAEHGVWSITGASDWNYQYYLYEVEVYARSENAVVTNLVTDPYSLSLSMNSTRSQIVNLDDPALMPDGWLETEKPPLAAPEDIVVYELHVRDFSITDQTVRPDYRGTFMAFTEAESDGMKHLRALAEAGLTHIHLLPSFDIATINENAAERTEPNMDELAEFGPASPEQQALIEPIRELDGFNWGYDPYHFNAPEGSYSTEPEGAVRIREFRSMVQSLNQAGLRVVMDVVYNHTNASGQAEKSVFDRIVPGYYHRLNADGGVETSTCCQNTATEHAMMGRFMVDSVVMWATAYKVDGFRFDLMGHHMVSDMEAVRAALDALTPAAGGVDGSAVYVYGEGWNFGEVANNARGVNATQLNLPGTGIGTFNDRLRDAVRGGGPFSPIRNQGFATGLSLEPNGATEGDEAAQANRLLLHMDQIRVGLAGNLRDYTFTDSLGGQVTGADIDYNGNPAGYTLDPQENIVYVSAHDNETIFDALMAKAPETWTLADRIRMNNLALSVVMFSQGVPFFHAGDDILRSKSFDRNSYNSGDWFNRLDWSYQTNNFGVGLPPAGDNEGNWELVAPLLENPDLHAAADDIQFANGVFREWLQIRRSSPLFRLHTAEEVQARVRFFNTGINQTPGLIAMMLDDTTGEDLDPNYGLIMVIFNATPETQTLTIQELGAFEWDLHPVLAESVDLVVREATEESGIFTVPARTTAVFVVGQRQR
ncbi:MAG: pullulanase-type alpha-1,6-glucosidase [Anaerolineae bacterium]|nr:pullulanase-type alpha-1,6-glucosidase [Anaerolineae bacterium]